MELLTRETTTGRTRLDEKAATVLARRDPLAAVMKSKIPSITIGLASGDKKHAICVLAKAVPPNDR